MFRRMNVAWDLWNAVLYPLCWHAVKCYKIMRWDFYRENYKKHFYFHRLGAYAFCSNWILRICCCFSSQSKIALIKVNYFLTINTAFSLALLSRYTLLSKTSKWTQTSTYKVPLSIFGPPRCYYYIVFALACQGCSNLANTLVWPIPEIHWSCQHCYGFGLR